MAANFTRTISCVEIWAHPTEGGARRVYLQYRTADAGALTTITTVDTTRYLCRKKGGGATRSFNSTTGEITTDGDYYFIPFTAAITMTDLKVWITDSNDQYGRICEVKAYREVDWTDRATALTVSQDADAALRRFRARTLTLGLSNTDGYLSYYGSDGGYNTEVGAGVVLRVYVGYEGTEKISQGVFYVDKWDEDPAKAAVKVSARDGAGIMGAEVRPNLKTNKTLDQVIEYLANLCRIASTDIDLDSVAQRVSYFLPEGGAAWTEAQRVAEAGSFATVYFDNFGYLKFISHANVPGLTGNESTFSTLFRVSGAFAQYGDYIYALSFDKPASVLKPRIAKYSLADGTWSYLTNPVDPAWYDVSASYPALGLVEVDASGERLFLLWAGNFATPIPPEQIRCESVVLATGSNPSPTERVQRAMDASQIAGLTEARATVISSVTYGDYILACWNSIDATPSNGLWVFGMRPPSIRSGSGTAGYRPHANFQAWHVVRESGRVIVLGVHTTNLGLQLYEVTPNTSTADHSWTLRATIGAGTDLRPTGMTATGGGYVWINYAAATGGATGKFTKITVPGWTVTTTADAWDSETVPTTTWARDAVAYMDGLVIAAVQRPGTAASTERQDIVSYDENTGEIVNIGPLGLSGSLITSLRSYTWSGGTTLLGILDGLRVFEVRPGARSVARQDSSIATIKDSDTLIGMQISVGDMKADQSIIVNRVSVKSTPRLAGSSKTVWKAQGLPWRVRANDELKFRLELTDDVDADTLAAVASYSGAAATIYLDGTNGSKKHHRTPTVVIKVTTGGTITALSVTGNELISGSLITESFGPVASLKRYRFRRMQIDNPYIYDSIAQTMIASDVLQRMSFANGPPVQITGVKSSALWHLEPLDRITVVHSTAGINADFYVVRFSHDYRAQTTSLDLVAVPG